MQRFSDHVIKCFEELHKHYDGTKNTIHVLSFSTDVSSNKVFTYKEVMTQEDTHLFVEVMQKEVANNCKIIGPQSIAQLFTELLSQFRLSGHSSVSDVQMVHSSIIKLDCALMAECNTGAQTTGKHTHQ